MNKKLEYSSLIKKLISCESREQLSDIIKEINEFNKKYSITSRSEEFKKFEIVIGVMRVKLKRKHDIIENQLRGQKQNNKTNMKIVITERQHKVLKDYINNETLDEDLGRWFKEKWVDVSKKVDGKHPPCGRKDADGKSYPKCRPSKKVSSETPKVSSSYDKDEKKAMTQQKRRAEKKDPKVGTGNKPTMTHYDKK
jgi:hypothetical protein